MLFAGFDPNDDLWRVVDGSDPARTLVSSFDVPRIRSFMPAVREELGESWPFQNRSRLSI